MASGSDTWDLSVNDCAALQEVLADRDALLAALRVAQRTIQAWHGDIAWDLYQQSPEMRAINSAIAKAEGT